MNIWQIRKVCVEALVEMSKICDLKDRSDMLTKLMLQFLDDPNKWVKVSAYKALGQFITTLSGGEINEKLFNYYAKMADNQVNLLGSDNEIIIACAYNFPGVLQTFGMKKWPEMKKLLSVLVKSKIKQIKRSIACGLHEVAKIIGQDKTETELFDILEILLKDPNDEVKYGAVENIVSFLEVFDKEKRQALLDILLVIQKQLYKWRIRELLAKQIDKLAKIYEIDIIIQYILPISFKLCNDTVYTVREEAAKKVYSLYFALKSESFGDMLVTENIKGFCNSERYSYR